MRRARRGKININSFLHRLRIIMQRALDQMVFDIAIAIALSSFHTVSWVSSHGKVIFHFAPTGSSVLAGHTRHFRSDIIN